MLEQCFSEAGVPLVPYLEIDSMPSALRLVRSEPYATVLPVSAIFGQHRKCGYALNPIDHARLRHSIAIVTNPSSRPSEATIQFASLFTDALRRSLARIDLVTLQT